MMRQVQQNNRDMIAKQRGFAEGIREERRKEQEYKDEVLRLLNEINNKLSEEDD